MQVLKSTVVGIDEWKANAVRLPMNESFWFGRNPLQKDGGKAYREKIDQIITLAANRGAYLILDLHRFRAPKAEHVEFWKDAAERYKNHPAVLFDLFNEPHGISWQVWRDGGFVGEKKGTDESAFLTDEEKKKNQGFESVGMQALIDAVRSTGAKNIVIAGGLGWAGDLSGVAEGYELKDPDGNGIMYSWHQYNWHKGWAKTVLPVAEKHPIFVGEVGADTNKMDFIPHEIQESPYTWIPDMLGFIQLHRLNWTGWCFHPRATPVMISDWKYTPTPFWGQFAKDALAGKQFEMKRIR
jgi:endoglucanase